MSNGRGSRTKVDSGRDSGAFIALPHTVLDSPAYLGLSANARSLLLEVALQFNHDNNGRMLLSREHLKKRGWKSNDMIAKGKSELLEAELIFETVKGSRPNKASWYAMTWRKLDKIKGFDPGADKAFERGAYRRHVPLIDVKKLKGYQAMEDKPMVLPQNAVVTPPHGRIEQLTAPSHGVEASPPAPSHGTIVAFPAPRSAPPHGHLLDLPSEPAVGARIQGIWDLADSADSETAGPHADTVTPPEEPMRPSPTPDRDSELTSKWLDRTMADIVMSPQAELVVAA